MFKRGISCILITVLMLTSALTVVAQPENNAENTVTSNATEVKSNKYSDYISANSALVGKGNTIGINAVEYSSTDSANISVNEALCWNQDGGSVTWDFEVVQDGAYELVLEYKPLGTSTDSVELAIKIDGQYPFTEAKSVFFERYWENDGGLRTDDKGNEFAPKVKQTNKWYQKKAYDPSGFNVDPLAFVMKAGQHQITIESKSQAVAIKSISFVPVVSAPDYAEYIKKYANAADYSGEPLVLEGEDAAERSKKSIVPLSDNSSTSIQPQSAFLSKINYIGSNNWNLPGDTITWNVDVKKSGFYTIKFSYRQNHTINENFYRELKIDGQTPFSQAETIAFPYSGSWSFLTFSDANDKPYKIYLEEGKRTLSLSVTTGPLSQVCGTLNDLVYELADFYRSIVMITGENPDLNRDYNLFKQIKDYDKRLKGYADILDDMMKELSNIAGNDSGSGLTILRNMKDVIERMRDNKYYAHQYKDRYYSNYAALSAWVYERSAMPLDIDAIFLDDANDTGVARKAGFIKEAVFSVQRFVASFASQYQGETTGKSDKSITLWINWGRDQAKVLKNLVSSDFTVEHGIDVKIKLTNATLLQGILSGNGPDCSLQVSRSEPVNLAMRGALYDLGKFDDYDEVMKRFMPGSDIPYMYEGGHYGIPNTQSFYMLFYREDIFNQMGLTLPETWDDFLNTSNLLLRKNMQVGLPYVQITDMSQVNAGVGALNIFPTLLMQKGISLYNDDLTASTLMEPETVKTFTQWVNYYNKYGFPKAYNFYDRFRVGLMPMAIVSYTMYATLSAAAPEISQLWKMAEVPGYRRGDGTIDHSVSGGGTAAIILKESKQPELAWEFIKWWTEADTQYAYASEVENILGTAARHDTANVEALKMLSWDKDNLDALLKQWAEVKEIQEIPGGYYMARVLDQAFWNTTNGEDAYETLAKWERIANAEIERKGKQYGSK